MFTFPLVPPAVFRIPCVVTVPEELSVMVAPPVVNLPTVIGAAKTTPAPAPVCRLMVPVPLVMNSSAVPSELPVKLMPAVPSPVWFRVCRVRLEFEGNVSAEPPKVPEVVMPLVA